MSTSSFLYKLVQACTRLAQVLQRACVRSDRTHGRADRRTRALREWLLAPAPWLPAQDVMMFFTVRATRGVANRPLAGFRRKRRAWWCVRVCAHARESWCVCVCGGGTARGTQEEPRGAACDPRSMVAPTKRARDGGCARGWEWSGGGKFRAATGDGGPWAHARTLVRSFDEPCLSGPLYSTPSLSSAMRPNIFFDIFT